MDRKPQRLRSWKELKERMYNRFRSREHGTACARFLAVKQEGSVSEYLQKFEELSAPLPEIAGDVLEGTFTNGLDPIIRKEVFSMRVVCQGHNCPRFYLPMAVCPNTTKSLYLYVLKVV